MSGGVKNWMGDLPRISNREGPYFKFFFFFSSSSPFLLLSSLIFYLAVNEWGWVGYEELFRSRRVLSTEALPSKICIILISIYILSDLGDLSNLIGSLSRTIQQYSLPSEWIMHELGFFPTFLENDLLKVDKRPCQGWLFLGTEKTPKYSKRRFFIYCSWVCGRLIVYNSRLFA